MKKILTLALLLISLQSFSAVQIKEGVYSNGDPSCMITVSIGDFFIAGWLRFFGGVMVGLESFRKR